MKTLLLFVTLISYATVSFGESIVEVKPLRETASAPSSEDAADDPAIWVHPTEPALSLILGTNKKGGLMVMDMQGEQVQYLEGGTPNNVDLREGFPLGGEAVSLAVASDRVSNSLLAWRVDTASRQLVPVPVRGCKPEMEVYGLCLYRSADTGKFYAFIPSKPGRVEQWELRDGGDGIDAVLARSFDLSGQSEGCVADDARGIVYIGEETKAIWRIAAEPSAEFAPVAVDRVKPEGRLTEDIEGLALCGGYLLASSQGDNTFAVYEAAGDNKFITRFSVAADDGIDEVTGTDGIEAVAADLGAGLESGVFVAQDDVNDGGNQNFKLVPWAAIAAALPGGH